ncbi:MAG: hypothetical protein ABI847_17740 [Anaerolineales bacterium]
MNAEPVFLLSHLFSLRLWPVEAADGRTEWRGKLEHVPSGENRYFQGWTALITGLCALLPEPGRAPLSADVGQPPDGEGA